MATIGPNSLHLIVIPDKSRKISAYVELDDDIDADDYEAKKQTTLGIYLYCCITGFNSSLIFMLMISTMQYFKDRFDTDTYSYLSLIAVKTPVVLACLSISFFRSISFSAQYIANIILTFVFFS